MLFTLNFFNYLFLFVHLNKNVIAPFFIFYLLVGSLVFHSL